MAYADDGPSLQTASIDNVVQPESSSQSALKTADVSFDEDGHMVVTDLMLRLTNDRLALGSIPSVQTLGMNAAFEKTIGYMHVGTLLRESTPLVYGLNYEISSWQKLAGYFVEDEEDITTLNAVPTAVGIYSVAVKGVGEYAGLRATSTFEIYDPFDFSLSVPVCKEKIELGQTPDATSLKLSVYDQTAKVGKFNTDGGYQYNYTESNLLSYGEDYEITGWYRRTKYDPESHRYTGSEALTTAPTEGGFYTVEISGIGNYKGSKKLDFEIVDVFDIASSYWQADCSNRVQEGDALSAETLGLSVFSDGKELTPGIDYVISGWYDWYVYDGDDLYYEEFKKLDSAPSEPDWYYAGLTGIGSYHGTRYVAFTISAEPEIDLKDLGNLSILSDDATEGDDIESNLSFRSYGTQTRIYPETEYTKLNINRDFKITGWYTIDDDEYALQYDDEYEGQYISYNTRLAEEFMEPLSGTPTEAGSYCVKIEGIGSYHGSNTVKVEVLKPGDPTFDVSNAWLHIHNNIQLGTVPNAENLGLEVSLEGKNLVEGVDYKISKWFEGSGWSAVEMEGTPSEPGRYTLEIVGIGDYRGSRGPLSHYSDFQIVDQYKVESANCLDRVVLGTNINSETLDLHATTTTGKQLSYGDDFEIVAWYNADSNIKLASPPNISGNYNVVVRGKGSYHGTAWTTFSIVNALSGDDLPGTTIEEFEVDYNSIMFKGTELNAETFELKVLDNSGKLLQVDKDYRIKAWYDFDTEYYDSENVHGSLLPEPPTDLGEYQFELEGIGSYEGIKLCRFSVRNPGTPITISESLVAVEEILDPSTLRIELADSQGNPLVFEQDYELGDWYDEGNAFRNHVLMGEAPVEAGFYSVDLIGKGAYSGKQWIKPVRIIDSSALKAFSFTPQVDYPSCQLELTVTPDYTYSNLKASPQLEKTAGSLELGKDYEVKEWQLLENIKMNEPPTEAGTYVLVLQGIGESGGETELHVTLQSNLEKPLELIARPKEADPATDDQPDDSDTPSDDGADIDANKPDERGDEDTDSDNPDKPASPDTSDNDPVSEQPSSDNQGPNVPSATGDQPGASGTPSDAGAEASNSGTAANQPAAESPTAEGAASASAKTPSKAAATVTVKANPMKVKAKKPSVKFAKLKKKAQAIKASKAFSISKAKGKVTFKKKSGPKGITVTKAGKIKLKKGLKKKTYKVKVAVTAAGNANYAPLTKTVTIKIRVK